MRAKEIKQNSPLSVSGIADVPRERQEEEDEKDKKDERWTNRKSGGGQK